MAAPAGGYLRKQAGVGEQLNRGINVPNIPLGVPSDRGTGNVAGALMGWPGKFPAAHVTFKPDPNFLSPRNNTPTKEDMFDIMGHSFLAEKTPVHKHTSKIEKKFPQNPRKNTTYVMRNNAIAEKHNKIEHRTWKMSKFEKNALPRISSFRDSTEAKLSEGLDGLRLSDKGGLGGDPCTCYNYEVGRPDSKTVDSPLEDRDISGAIYTEQPYKDLKDLNDEQLFQI